MIKSFVEIKMLKEKGSAGHSHSSSSQNLLAELSSHVSKAAMLVELYEKHANSEIRNEGELGSVQREMKVIKSRSEEHTSELQSQR